MSCNADTSGSLAAVSSGTQTFVGLACWASASVRTYERRHGMGHGKRTKNGASGVS